MLLQETIALLGCRPGGLWVDGTVGGGGHAEAILRATAPGGRLLGLDRDPDALAIARTRLRPFGARAILRHADFRSLPGILDAPGPAVPGAPGFERPSGILLDLGISSHQLDDGARGFSFQTDGPLDMRMDRTGETTAAALVNNLAPRALADLFARYGGEREARRIAAAIARARARQPIATTGELAGIIEAAVPARGPRRIHPATRVFQALRIAVNDELKDLDRLIEEAAARLAPGGRMAVIAFHSLEDRAVKTTFRALASRCVCPPRMPVCGCARPNLMRLVTRRPVRPGPDELRLNPRSRSARLRVAERLETP